MSRRKWLYFTNKTAHGALRVTAGILTDQVLTALKAQGWKVVSFREWQAQSNSIEEESDDKNE